ncbi:MAG TPA: hypothetical protein PKZ00_03955 [Elusimicrobiota bacterium]|nr:hypothetical protein [Elusimicrobiota bacterium]
MTGRRVLQILIWSGMIAVGCRRTEAPPAPPAFDPVALEARFPADLGTATLDVSGYPPEKKSHYALFSEKCAGCHSLARPLNSPWTAEVDWRRYVERMETNNEDKTGKPLLTPVEAKKIISFLVYDSRERKMKNRAGFEAEQARLKDLYAKVVAERNRLAAAQSKSQGRESSPYVGDR